MNKLNLVFLIMGWFCSFASPDSKDLKKQDILSWPRARADRFGCFLEKSFGYKDKLFNCALKNYVNKGDICKNTEAWYEGPTFPMDMAKTIHPWFESIGLSWEHGDLQGIEITLNRKLDEQEVRKQFRFPKKPNDTHRNVMSITIQLCSLKATCIVIQGFEHLGASDVDCGEGEYH